MDRLNAILFVANGAAAEPYAMARAAALAEASSADLLTVMNIRGKADPQVVKRTDAENEGRSGYRVSGTPVLPLRDGSRVRLEADCTLQDVIDAAQSHDLVITPAHEPTSPRSNRLLKEERMLMRDCSCPVLVIKRQDHEQPRRILAVVSLDLTLEDSTQARSILASAAALAKYENAKLEVVANWQIRRELELRGRINIMQLMAEMEAAHRKQLAALVDECAYPDTIAHVAYGDPLHVVPALAKRREIDLVVVSNAKPTALARLFAGTSAERLLTGTNTARLLKRLDCSLVAISADAASEASAQRQGRRPDVRNHRPRMANSAHA